MSNLNFPCGICSKNVHSNAEECCLGLYWIHHKCEGLTRKELNQLKDNNNRRYRNCVQILPFHELSDDDELIFVNSDNEQSDCVVNKEKKVIKILLEDH